MAYHVVGSGPTSGIQAAPGSPARLFADLLIDLRMPLFAFLAGCLDAVRPARAGGLGDFVAGKSRRLLVPGVVAATAFAAAAAAIDSPFDRGWDVIEIYLMPYAHYWYLQALFVVMVVYAAFDIATKGKATEVALGFFALAFLWQVSPPTTVFSLNSTIYLGYYFAIGVFVCRRWDHIVAHRSVVLCSSAFAIAAGLCLQVAALASDGALLNGRTDVQSFLTSTGVCAGALFVAPRSGLLAFVGTYSFTIYLYHVFGTSGARRALQEFGVDQTLAHVVVGTAAGVLLPVMLHQIVRRSPVAATLVLGVRGDSAARRAPAGVTSA